MNTMRALAFIVSVLVVAVTSCSQTNGDRNGLAALNNAIEVTNVPPPQAGAFILPRLGGEAATNQSQRLEHFRQLPKRVTFEARTFKARGENLSLRYLLFTPTDAASQAHPLVLSLHGGGPRHRFEDLLEPNAPGFAYGLGRLVSPETQKEHPCFVVAPWSGERGWDESNLRLVLALLDHLQTEFKIDHARIYVTGQSMGGFGTWAIITQAPERFAAAVPICGGGDPHQAAAAKSLPIWAFHGSGDTVVPVEETRRMINALVEFGGHPSYWEYKGATHADTAERAYCEPKLIEWMFAQRRAQ
jgi:predicted peptidase